MLYLLSQKHGECAMLINKLLGTQELPSQAQYYMRMFLYLSMIISFLSSMSSTFYGSHHAQIRINPEVKERLFIYKNKESIKFKRDLTYSEAIALLLKNCEEEEKKGVIKP